MGEFVIGATIEGAEPVQLDPRRFNRHTFWCGQSGSGETYALGVVLERLLLHTELPVLVFDPNADFVRLREIRPGTDDAAARRLGELDVRVFRSGRAEGERLRVRYVDLSPAAKAAVLRIDPIADAEEYNALLHTQVSSGQFDSAEMIRGPRDLAELAEVFGFASEDAIRRAQIFAQGQALFDGGFIAEPTFVQMGARLTEEAGGDVRVPMA